VTKSLYETRNHFITIQTVSRMKIAKQILSLFAIAFVFHLIWENSQAPLFTGYSSFGQHLPICFLGTIGDVAFTTAVYIGIAMLKNDFGWIVRLGKKDIFVLAVIGFFFALGIEWRAILFDRWSYTEAMPIIPYFQVGLAPIIQMSILLPLSFYITELFNKNSKNHSK